MDDRNDRVDAHGPADDEEDRGLATVLFALVMDGALTVAKFVGFVISGSSSMLAETFHSGAETANQGLLLWGRHRADDRDPQPSHPFGYARERYFWPFIVSILIFAIGSLGSAWHAIGKLRHPEELGNITWALGILVAALLFDGASWINALRQAGQEKRGSYWGYVKRSRQPEIPMILLEDTAAVTGAVLAMVGLGLSLVTGNPAFDAIGSVAIAVLLAAVAWVLAREMKSLLIGESALPEDEEAIRDVFRADDHVLTLVSLRTLHLGPEDLLVEAKLELRDELTSSDVARVIDGLEDAIRDAVPRAGIIAIEPDLARGDDPEVPSWAKPEPMGPDARAE